MPWITLELSRPQSLREITEDLYRSMPLWLMARSGFFLRPNGYVGRIVDRVNSSVLIAEITPYSGPARSFLDSSGIYKIYYHERPAYPLRLESARPVFSIYR